MKQTVKKYLLTKEGVIENPTREYAALERTNEASLYLFGTYTPDTLVGQENRCVRVFLHNSPTHWTPSKNHIKEYWSAHELINQIAEMYNLNFRNCDGRLVISTLNVIKESLDKIVEAVKIYDKKHSSTEFHVITNESQKILDDKIRTLLIK